MPSAVAGGAIARSGDFDGDGTSEIAIFSKSLDAAAMLRFDLSSSKFLQIAWSLPEAAGIDDYIAGQFTPDHCEDLMGVELATGVLHLFESNCRDGFNRDAPLEFASRMPWNRIFRIALDDDGIDDLAAWNQDRFDLWLSLLSTDKTFSRSWRVNTMDQLVPQGVIDSRADEPQEVLFYRVRYQEFWAHAFKDTSRPSGYFPVEKTLELLELRGGASFSKYDMWSFYQSGDYDGDGLGEILAYDAKELGWWLARGNGRTFIEQAVAPLLPAGVDASPLSVGDFDGDGASDIVFCPGDGQGCYFARQQHGPPLGSARFDIRPEGNMSPTLTVTTDGSGHGVIELPPGRYEVVAEEGKQDFTAVSRKITLKHSQLRSIHFLGIPEDDAGIVGRALSFGTRASATGPYVCTGYHPEPYSGYHKWGMSRGNCPVDYIMINVREAGWSKEDLLGNCCRLPTSDILTDRMVETADQCPDGSVVAGYYPTRLECNHPDCFMRVCRFINTQRYQLGKASNGVYWGLGYSSHSQQRQIRKDLVPSAIRYALGRGFFDYWEPDGCIGLPFGSVLVGGKSTGLCSSYIFREIQYKGLPGDPPAGAPVKMFPDCYDGIDPFDPTSGCRERWAAFAHPPAHTIAEDLPKTTGTGWRDKESAPTGAER